MLLVDASILIFRAWFTIADRYHDADGWPVNAVVGYWRDLQQLLKREPTHIACCFDTSLRTGFRHRLYPPYKANRPPAPEELKRQFDYCRQLTRAAGIAEFASEEFEADDLLASLAALCRDEQRSFTIITRDKDLAQLLGPQDRLWDGRAATQDFHGAIARFGVQPKQLPDWQALTGDAIDGIPGVAGVGPKIATRLLKHFSDLEGVFDAAEATNRPTDFPGGLRAWNALQGQRDNALLFRELTRLRADAPTVRALDDIRHGSASDNLLRLLERLNIPP